MHLHIRQSKFGFWIRWIQESFLTYTAIKCAACKWNYWLSTMLSAAEAFIHSHWMSLSQIEWIVMWIENAWKWETQQTSHIIQPQSYSKCKIVATIGKIAFFGYTEKYCINIDFITDPTFYRAFGDFLEFNEWNKAFSIPSTYISLVLA